MAAETVAYLRLRAGRRPDDTQLAALVGELSMKSDDFRRLWVLTSWNAEPQKEFKH